MSKLMVSVSGIRGIIGETLTPDIIVKYTTAFVRLVGPGPIIVARDSRTTGEMVESLVTGMLLSHGCKVIKLGIVPTPTAEIKTLSSDANGGIIITASHNPSPWNALKLINRNGMFLQKPEVEKLKELSNDCTNHTYVSWDKVTTLATDTSAMDLHGQKILSLPFIDLEAIKKKHFTVVLDSNHGAGGILGRKLLEQLECKVITLGEEPNGHFIHSCEPIPENLDSLSAKVKEIGADIGFALDPDGDRVAVVSEQGVAIGEEYTLAIATQCMLSRKKGPVTINLSTSRMAEDIAAQYNVPCYRTPVGEINVSSAMKNNGSVIGGEGNGGAMIPEVFYGRDAYGSMILVLQYLTDTNEPISQAINHFPSYVMRKEKIDLVHLDAEAALRTIENEIQGDNTNKDDGLRISWCNSWTHIRKSNTEPILRIITEAQTEKEVEEISQKIKKIIMK